MFQPSIDGKSTFSLMNEVRFEPDHTVVFIILCYSFEMVCTSRMRPKLWALCLRRDSSK